MARPYSKMTSKMENFIRAEARGEPHDKILIEIFGVDPADKKAKAQAEQYMWRWRNRPDADAIWQDELKKTVRRRVPAAMNRILKQVDSQTEWLANKAANDIMTLASRTGIIQNEEQAMQIQIQGMPDIGSPDDE